MTKFQRGLDHLVLCVPGLPLARAFWENLGFTGTPDAYHPFGTCNFLIQLDQVFLEILTIGDAAKIHEHEGNAFSFPAHNRDFLKKRGPGFSMLVLDSQDSEADQADYQDAGLAPYDPFSFGRKAVLPDGSSAEVKFSLTFVSEPALPDAAFFTCRQHHPPELFWKPDYQKHPNSARSVTEVALVSSDPSALQPFLEKFARPKETMTARDEVRLHTHRGDIVILSPDRFIGRYGENAPQEANGLSAFTIGVADLAVAEDYLNASGLAVQRIDNRLCLSRQDCFGVSVAFEQV